MIQVRSQSRLRFPDPEWSWKLSALMPDRPISSIDNRNAAVKTNVILTPWAISCIFWAESRLKVVKEPIANLNSPSPLLATEDVSIRPVFLDSREYRERAYLSAFDPPEAMQVKSTV